MSPQGQSRRFNPLPVTSDLPRTTDINNRPRWSDKCQRATLARDRNLAALSCREQSRPFQQNATFLFLVAFRTSEDGFLDSLLGLWCLRLD